MSRQILIRELELSKLVKSLIKKLYKPALLIVTLQGLFIAFFIRQSRPNKISNN